MSHAENQTYHPGARIAHPELGAGVVLETLDGGYLRVFFGVGERRVPVSSIRRELSRTEPKICARKFSGSCRSA